MIKFKPAMGDLLDVIKTSPGRIDPRSGKLVRLIEYDPVAPWEEDRSRSRRDRGDDLRQERGSDREDAGPGRFRRDEDEPRSRSSGRRMPWSPSSSSEDRERSLVDVIQSRMSGPSKMGAVGDYFGNVIPWVFIGIAAVVALEASGVTNFSSKK